MITVKVPGYKILQIKYLVLDFNGTLALDGKILPGVKEILNTLAQDIEIHVLTADTFGQAQSQLKDVCCKPLIIPLENQDMAKLNFVKNLGTDYTACIGNGQNDHLMLKESALGIAVILKESAAVLTVMSADIVCTSILSALELFTNPLRLTATLRL
ncbi:HAD domain-containing protein [Desulfonema limicola]|uniref:HAD domain-containing protein n=1 Tax=Desulfonema limicola TaxID=45656 RepID=A0A975B750_9BACT|nr:ATPase P [Desulfonema limicola]QTA79989.1 HAD domain-containing protein [Desulfonema limicola]